MGKDLNKVTTVKSRIQNQDSTIVTVNENLLNYIKELYSDKQSPVELFSIKLTQHPLIPTEYL